jgi:hypothetical protein
MQAEVRDALLELDQRNVASEKRTPNVGGVLPASFHGAPDTVFERIERCRNEVGVGVLDLLFSPRAPPKPDAGCGRSNSLPIGATAHPRAVTARCWRR